MALKIGVFIGSLSAVSINRKLANALTRLAPEGVELVEIPIAGLPLYNHDLDADYPQVARDFKQAIAEADALLYVTPEYNRSIPGALKNAIDWASRPWGQNSLGKPSATIGASPGPISTAVAQQHLKDILLFSDAPVLGQPEGYIQFTEGLITDDGEVTNDGTAEFLRNWITAFASFAEKQLG
ncbi:NAD(P)H-dependent oxidoreductase [Leucobacter weissii]|uniref:NAD(P)H-dependent oxidoreductase n=1 Tax=Leucobacter weissii TaxID=1983706 RepID=A0A939S9D3_9MICO|nr:NADPH-dependent FMN reductase [Leucobacter weissii]MBO1903026.1 NAD(P)H-dependent oxidoreductase [Leucobacter weissii]